MNEGIDLVQDREWQILHGRITEKLNLFGRKDAFGNGDYWLVDDNWGWKRHQLEIRNLNLIKPEIITMLQTTLSDYPEWCIMAGVYPGLKQWPEAGMGLVIYKDEIIDELQRRYLPPEYRDLHYVGSRRIFDANDV